MGEATANARWSLDFVHDQFVAAGAFAFSTSLSWGSGLRAEYWGIK